MSQQGPLRRICSLGALGEVRLGSESSSGGAGGVWKSGNLEMREVGDLETRNVGSNKSKTKKLSKSKSILPKMLARSGLVGKKSSRPHLDGPTNQKCNSFAYFPWWALAAIHPGWGNRYNMIVFARVCSNQERSASVC